MQRIKQWMMIQTKMMMSTLANSSVEFKGLKIFIVAGEVSGDIIGGRLMSSLNLLSPSPLSFSGVGGTLMRKEGLTSLFPMGDLSVMGIWELLPHLRNLSKRLNETTEAAVQFKPHAIVTIDSKGFCFRLLKRIHARYAELGLPRPMCFHYVAPSFWAWKGGERRLGDLSKIVDHMLCILPFEEDICKRYGLDATFVGHPVLEDVIDYHSGAIQEICKWRIQGNGTKFRREHGISTSTSVITLLPGSRLQEVSRMLPLFESSLEIVMKDNSDFSAVIVVSPDEQVAAHVKSVVERWSIPVVLVSGDILHASYDAYDASVAALCTSGTAVLQLQLARLPCVVAYRSSLVTEWLIKLRTKLQYISLPNILTDSPAIPEVLFSDCVPTNLSSLIRKIIQRDDIRQQQIATADRIFEMLSPPAKVWNKDCLPESEQKLRTLSPSIIAASTIMRKLKEKVMISFH